MCQVEYFREFQRAASSNRMAPYLSRSPDGDAAQAFGYYLWNLALCESLYLSLHGIEVALRNSIHQAASAEFDDEFWFRHQLFGLEKENIDKLDREFSKIGVPADSGRYIAACTFGFWVNLFIGRYEQILWTRLLPAVFPHAPRRLRKRNELRARLDRTRRLRNRVFHHEPIWHWRDLAEQHGLILETIGWINPAMAEMTRLLDRFPRVYTEGVQPYAAELDSIAQSWARAAR